MKLIATSLTAALLTGCYVVPIDMRQPPVYPHAAPQIAPQPIPAVLHARLYPLNETAGKMGALNATVTDHANGHAVFSLAHDGEILQGEASRIDGKRGVAGAAGPRGTYVKCEYVLAAYNRGTGSCQFSNGARYQLHFGG
jgi:hypothetical protein